MRSAVWLGIALVFYASAQAQAGEDSLRDWRDQARQVRELAENNAPAALREAQRLQATLPANAAPEDQARALNLLARAEVYLMHIPEARVHARQAQTLAIQHGDRIGQAEADLNLAMSLLPQGEFEPLDEIVSHSMIMLQGQDRPDLLGEAMWLSTVHCWRQSQLEKVVNMALRSLEWAQQENDPIALAFAHWSMARLFELNNRHEEAREHALKMYQYARVSGRRRMEAQALSEWAYAALTLEAPAINEQRIRAAINIDQATKIPHALAANLLLLAVNQQQQGKSQEAIDLLDQAVTMNRRYQHKTGLWWSLMTRSEYARTSESASLADAEQAWALAKEIDLPMFLLKSGRRLAEIERGHGHWKQAYAYASAVDQAQERLTSTPSGERIVALARLYMEDSKRRRIDALTLQNAQQRVRHQWMLGLLGSGLVLLSVVMIFLIYQRKSHRRLEAAHHQLQQSQARLIESEGHLSSLAAHMPGFSYTFRCTQEKDGGFTYIGPGIRDLLQLFPSDVIANPGLFHACIHPEDQALVRKASDKALSGLTEFHVEVRAKHPVKGEVWVEMRSTPVRMPDRSIHFHGYMADVTARKHMEAALQESQTLLRALAEHTESIREAERRRLAREVHDELGQMLNVLRLNLLVLERRFGRDNPEMQDVVGTLLEHLGRTIGIARNIVSALYPTVLDAGIAAALDWLAQEFGKSTGIACHLFLEEPIELDEKHSIALYRIVQESLTNIARHSGAAQAEIRLFREGSHFVLEVSDDGCGLDAQAPKNPQSLGLVGMRERAIMLNGVLCVIGRATGGTTIQVVFSVNHNKETL